MEQQVEMYEEELNQKKYGNIPLGVLGALIFSLGGVALYLILYWANFIAWISGFVMYTLAALGYGLFTKTKDKPSFLNVLIPGIITVVMILVSELLGLSIIVHNELTAEYGNISFLETLSLIPYYLEDEAVLSAVLEDVGFMYLMGIISVIYTIRTRLKR